MRCRICTKRTRVTDIVVGVSAGLQSVGERNHLLLSPVTDFASVKSSLPQLLPLYNKPIAIRTLLARES
jgi:hypothetical protein